MTLWKTVWFMPVFAGLLNTAVVGRGEGPLRVTGERFEMELSPENGSILRLSEKGKAGTIVAGGEDGLWQAKLLDGTTIQAAAFSTGSAERRFQCSREGTEGAWRLSYRSREIDVTVLLSRREDGVELTADVTPHGGTILEFALPARLRFPPESLDRLVCPADGNQSVGTALLPSFFKEQAHPTSWKSHVVGSKGYESLLGGPLAMRPNVDPAVPLRVTDEGRKWLGNRVPAGAVATVNRPPKPGQADLILVDSEHGPYFSASSLGGQGRLWRIGGSVGSQEERLATAMVGAAIERLAAQRPERRDKIGLLALQGGPAYGSWTAVSVRRWEERFRGLRAVAAGKVEFVELATVEQMNAARSGAEFLAILNPYGEWLPARQAGDMAAAVAAIGRYVREGGHWFEIGGYPFFCELLPAGRFQSYAVGYPPAFADFFHLQTRAGTAAIHRVQPRNWEPWRGLQDKHAIFVPGQVACGGDEKGGWIDRPFVTYVASGSPWRCPAVRLSVGRSARESLRVYAESNGIRRRLEEKMPSELLDRFKRSVLVYYAGTCAEKLRELPLLPVPTQIHFADYLHGGFDKQYPDHLPPSPRFGTPEEYRQFIAAAHKLGHLVVPYTNPTWWCDDPKGPTFEKHGEEPLLRLLDDTVSRERYSANTGFTVCHWHAAVQEANRLTVRQFRTEYPVDVLFQDQCGARGWRYDRNPASPTPYAYVEGLLSMIDEDSRRAPLSTESGWDRVVNAESQLCGMTWSLVPTEGGPAWRQFFKQRYDPATWEIFPLAQYLAHDKTAMIHHDLGQFVTNRQTLAWTLGLGFSLSYRVHAPALSSDAVRQWLLWLDRLQKSVCARYVGQALEDFGHERGPGPAPDDDGLLRSTYRSGSLRVAANLGPRPRREVGQELAGYGFLVQAPDLVAANLARAGSALGDEGFSFLVEGDHRRIEVWIYARPGDEAVFVPPVAFPKPITLVFDDGTTIPTTPSQSAHRLRLPRQSRETAPSAGDARGVKYLWHAVSKPE